MIHTHACANPYAKAAFETALAQNTLSHWQTWLSSATCIVRNRSVRRLCHNPRVDDAALTEFLLDVLTNSLPSSCPMDASSQCFLRLLVRYRRLNILSSIADVFDQLLAAHKNTMTITVQAADTLTDAQQALLTGALEKRLQCNVVLQYRQDTALLGGALIRMGDSVIDGSIRGKLAALHQTLRENTYE